jgi:hypothetical protein
VTLDPGENRVFVGLPGGGYAFTRLDRGVRIEFRYLRRKDGQLHAECDVSTDIPGASLAAGSLSCADLNLSSQRERLQRAKYCADRAHTWKLTNQGRKTGDDEVDFVGIFDEACVLAIRAEREGLEAIVLDDAPEEGPPQDFLVHGLSVPSDSHSQIIADGDGLKSLILLLVLGTLAQLGIPVAYLDWEWTAARHKARKRRLFGISRLEHLHYRHCRNPLAVELDAIRRFCDEKQIQFLAIDSVGLACDGKLADDDVARAYNRALDYLPPSLAAAHIPKNAEGAANLKAFGSAFFHNFARLTFTVKKQDGDSDDVVAVLITRQKQNDGARLRPVCLEFTFDPDRIAVRNVDPVTVQAFVEDLPLWQRMKHALTPGPQTIARLAQDLGANAESLERTVRRKNGLFTRVPGPDGVARIALLEGRYA